MRDRRNVIPGVPRESERAIAGLVAELDERLRKLERSPGRAGIVSSDTAAKPGELLNIEAPVTGLTVILPQPTAALIDSRVTLCFRNANPVRLVSISGLVNRESFVLNTAPGTFEAVCDGIDGWSVEIGVSSSGSAVDAEYVVATAHASLPNAAVGTDTTEVNFSFTPGSIATWVLNTASVAFSKLANLAGLSVLGRAANSSGVMAAITASGPAQYLRSSRDGLTLEWSQIDYMQWPVTLATGTINNYALPTGIQAGDTLRVTITGNTTLAGIVPPYEGFWFQLALANRTTQTAQLAIVDEGAGSSADNRIKTPGTESDAGGFDSTTYDYIMGSEEECAILTYAAVSGTNRWRISAGTAAQAISGAVTVAAGKGGTRSSSFSGIRDNGVLETARGFLNLVSSTSVTLTGTQDAGNDEIEITAQRAALTGAVAASANANATLFAGIRDNGAAENDRTNLNFVSSSTISLSVTDDSGNDELEITAALIGTTTEVTIASATGNLGTINIAALECGGSVRVTSASSAYSIEGFTAKTNGFWFYFEAAQGTTNHCTLFDEDATATAANRLQLPLSEDINQSGEIRGIFYYRNSRWNFTGNDPKRIGTTTTGVVVTGTQINLAVPASDINITAGGNVNVTGSGTGLLVGCNTFVDGYLDLTEQASVTAPAAGHSKVWVDDGSVQSLRFTDEAGRDRTVNGGTNSVQNDSSAGTGVASVVITLNDETRILRMTSNSAWSIGQLIGGWNGRELSVVCVSTGTGGLSHNFGASADSISCPGGADISGNRFGCTLIYDGQSTLWRVTGVNQI